MTGAENCTTTVVPMGPETSKQEPPIELKARAREKRPPLVETASIWQTPSALASKVDGFTWRVIVHAQPEVWQLAATGTQPPGMTPHEPLTVIEASESVPPGNVT
jgi:hypothetical protein